MSVAATQAAIASAVGTVAGVTSHDRKPDSVNEGDAWVVWVQSEPVLPGAFDCIFRVIAVLPFDTSTALDRAHVLMGEITDMVQSLVLGAAVTRVRSGRLAGENSTPVLTFDVRAAATYGE